MARHSSLADQLTALLAYRNRPEGKPETVKTNWKTVAANDNNPEDLAELHIERRRAIRPTIGEIIESVNADDIEHGKHVEKLAGGEVKEHTVITRIGKLRFSDGSQTERAYRYSVDGKLIEYDATMPVGAMLGARDRQERVLGGDTVVSNTGYTLVYGGKHPNKAKRKDPERRADEKPAQASTKAAMRAELAALPAHTATVCKTGFPWKPSNLRELFIGLEKGKKGESGSVAWEDISTHIVEREVWAETLAALSGGDVKTMDVALTAKTMREIGEAHGFTGKRAERMGKKILRAANDNLAVALKKSAA